MSEQIGIKQKFWEDKKYLISKLLLLFKKFLKQKHLYKD